MTVLLLDGGIRFAHNVLLTYRPVKSMEHVEGSERITERSL